METAQVLRGMGRSKIDSSGRFFGKSNKGYKVSGSRNPLSKRFCHESNEVRMQTVVRK